MNDDDDIAHPGNAERPTEGLSDRQLEAVRDVVTGLTPSQVAGRARVTRQTVWRWMRSPAFQAELRRLRRAMHERRLDRLARLFDGAITVVDEHVQEGDAGTALQVMKLFGPGMLRSPSSGEEWTQEATSAVATEEEARGLSPRSVRKELPSGGEGRDGDVISPPESGAEDRIEPEIPAPRTDQEEAGA